MAAIIRSQAGSQEATVFIAIDQLEEAINRNRAGALPEAGGLDRADIFLMAVREALAQSDHRLMVISTLRADTIGDFQRHRATRERSSLGDVIRVQAHQLGALPSASFFAIIQGPNWPDGNTVPAKLPAWSGARMDGGWRQLHGVRSMSGSPRQTNP